MTVRLRDTNRKELRDPRMAEHGAPKFLLMRCGALLRLDRRDARPYTSNGWAGEAPVPTRAKARLAEPWKIAKTRFCRNLVKPPGASVSCQAADSDGNINLKIWQVYPLQFAILEIETKSRNKQARPGNRFAPFLLES